MDHLCRNMYRRRTLNGWFKKRFTALAKKENEKIIFTHCFLHRKNLVAKTIRNELKEVMDQMVQMVNHKPIIVESLKKMLTLFMQFTL